MITAKRNALGPHDHPLTPLPQWANVHRKPSHSEERNVRRTRTTAVLLTIASILMLSGQQASGQVAAGVDRFEAHIFGRTRPDDTTHQLGVGRVTGHSELEVLQIVGGTLDCDDGEIVSFPGLRQPAGHNVRFRVDEDITDGFGEVEPTDDARAFRDDAAQAIRAGGVPGNAEVEVRVLTGRFHRLLNYVEVFLRLDIRVVQGGVEICEAADHEIRILFWIIGTDDHSGGFLVDGEARTHELPQDNTSLVRAACGGVPGAWHELMRTIVAVNGGPNITALEPLARFQISPDHRSFRIEPEVRTGRGGFEPCKPPTE
jgi:hypothetical protein